MPGPALVREPPPERIPPKVRVWPPATPTAESALKLTALFRVPPTVLDNVPPLSVSRPVPRAAGLPATSMPALMVVPPLKVFEPKSVSVPAPTQESFPAPATGLEIVSVMPEPGLNVPPPEPRVTPLFGLFRAKLPTGWRVPLSRTSCPALNPAGLPPRLVWDPARIVAPLFTHIGPVNAVALSLV